MYYLGRETEGTLGVKDVVQGSISLTLLAKEASQGHVVGLTGVATVLINLTDAELHGAVVLSVDDTVSGSTLAGHVEINNLTLIVLHGETRRRVKNKAGGIIGSD